MQTKVLINEQNPDSPGVEVISEDGAGNGLKSSVGEYVKGVNENEIEMETTVKLSERRLTA